MPLSHIFPIKEHPWAETNHITSINKKVQAHSEMGNQNKRSCVSGIYPVKYTVYAHSKMFL